MSHQRSADPLPTLMYHEDERSAPFRALVGLVLMAGAISAAMDTVGHASVLLRSWHHAHHAVQDAAPSTLESLSLVVTAAQIFCSVCAVVGCLISATTARALVFTLFAEAALIALLAISILMQISNYVTIGATASHLFLLTLLAQMASTFIHASLIPAMVIVVLLRPDMRPR